MLDLSENQFYHESQDSSHRGDQKKVVIFLCMATLERNLQPRCWSDQKAPWLKSSHILKNMSMSIYSLNTRPIKGKKLQPNASANLCFFNLSQIFPRTRLQKEGQKMQSLRKKLWIKGKIQ